MLLFSGTVATMRAAALYVLVLALFNSAVAAGEPRLSSERVVFQTDFGDIEMGFYPDVSCEGHSCGARRRR